MLNAFWICLYYSWLFCLHVFTYTVHMQYVWFLYFKCVFWKWEALSQFFFFGNVQFVIYTSLLPKQTPSPIPGLMFILKFFNEGCVFQSLSKCGENVSNLSLQEMLKKCHLCMESIVQAKDRQAAEANKNASILLEELDLEKVMEFFTWSPFCIIVLFLP